MVLQTDFLYILYYIGLLADSIFSYISLLLLTVS